MPISPTLRQQVNQYALQVTRKGCSDKMFARSMPARLSADEFNSLHRSTMQAIRSELQAKYPKAQVIGNLRSGESGYVYASVPDLAEGTLLIMSRQTINNQPHIVQYGCQLRR